MKKVGYVPYLLLSGFLVIGVASAATNAQELQAESVNLFGKENAQVIYTSSSDQFGDSKLTSLTYGLTKDTLSIGDENSRQEIYLSPNREYIAVTYEPNEEQTLTYVTDLKGNVVVSPHLGYFVSWAPDSSKVLLFLSNDENPNGRQIYYLGLDGSYQNSGLPKGVISADISPKDGTIVYSLTNDGDDSSDLYLQGSQGQDRLLIKGQGNVFTWVRWSPDGSQIAFMEADLGLAGAGIWLMNPGSTHSQRVSDIVWNYPPMFSPDGSHLAFSDGTNILEYDISNKNLSHITEFFDKTASHPVYSADGETLLFSVDSSDNQQIWANRDGVASQITTGSDKDYPIAP